MPSELFVLLYFQPMETGANNEIWLAQHKGIQTILSADD
jgi:hypothetical protein